MEVGCETIHSYWIGKNHSLYIFYPWFVINFNKLIKLIVVTIILVSALANLEPSPTPPPTYGGSRISWREHQPQRRERQPKNFSTVKEIRPRGRVPNTPLDPQVTKIFLISCSFLTNRIFTCNKWFVSPTENHRSTPVPAEGEYSANFYGVKMYDNKTASQ